MAGAMVLRGQPGPLAFTAWFLSETGALAGVAGIDSPREVRAGQTSIRAGRPVDPEALADRAVTPQRLAWA